MSDTLHLPCDRCGDDVPVSADGILAAHPCLTPRQRARRAVSAAAADIATLDAAVNAAPELTRDEWRDVARLARESRAEAQRALNALHVAIRDARARESSK